MEASQEERGKTGKHSTLARPEQQQGQELGGWLLLLPRPSLPRPKPYLDPIPTSLYPGHLVLVRTSPPQPPHKRNVAV